MRKHIVRFVAKLLGVDLRELTPIPPLRVHSRKRRKLSLQTRARMSRAQKRLWRGMTKEQRRRRINKLLGRR